LSFGSRRHFLEKPGKEGKSRPNRWGPCRRRCTLEPQKGLKGNGGVSSLLPAYIAMSGTSSTNRSHETRSRRKPSPPPRRCQPLVAVDTGGQAVVKLCRG